MIIDNFDIFRKHMTFKEPTDRYIVHILRRPKDCKRITSSWGSNECQRLLRTYYIDSMDYFDRKIEAMKELCTTNRARAYILPQVRNNFDCLLGLGEKVLETIRLGNVSVKPEHLLRSAYCENHSSRDKKWILDLDGDSMFGWTLNEVKTLVEQILADCGKSADDSYVVETKSGHHIVTSPFDLKRAQITCPFLYEGERSGYLLGDVLDAVEGDDIKELLKEEYRLHLVDEFTFTEWIENHRNKDAAKHILNKLEGKKRKLNGWLHKDGMSLLYLNMED